ncbi:MAG: hypothetical protein IKP64_13585, partial [Selenomonadaceae bacterium]|nr:hypothetical protein [Selenomonadaceae bacterium]
IFRRAVSKEFSGRNFSRREEKNIYDKFFIAPCRKNFRDGIFPDAKKKLANGKIFVYNILRSQK